MVYPKRGAQLAREMKWLGSYRYAVFNTGAASVEELAARFAAACADFEFHPAGRPLGDGEARPAAALGD
jgi:hypothetical protein